MASEGVVLTGIAVNDSVSNAQAFLPKGAMRGHLSSIPTERLVELHPTQ
jgi:hypothetical protein